MLKYSTKNLTGDEVLAIDIVNESDIVLIPEKTVLKKVYIEKLLELEIDYVYIEYDIGQEEEETIMNCCETVKNLMSSTYINDDEKMKEFEKIADSILDEVLHKPEVIFNVNNLRHKRGDLYEHSVNVCALSIYIGLCMQMSNSDLSTIAIGSLLHDIGYCYVDSILANNEVSDDIKIKEKKKHVVYGYSIAQKVGFSEEIKDIIIAHHERINGTGYPFKKKDNEISKVVRIVTVANEFDNIVNNEKKGKTDKVYEAIEAIVNNAGIYYDKEVIEIFRQNVYLYPTGTLINLSTGEKGIVTKQNSKLTSRPIVKIIEDNNGNKVTNKERDLSKELTVFIERVLE